MTYTIVQKSTYVTILARNDDFDADNIHYKGHWKGWALKIETFWGPEMATSKASANSLVYPCTRMCLKHVRIMSALQ
jgi:hypothetical protein